MDVLSFQQLAMQMPIVAVVIWCVVFFTKRSEGARNEFQDMLEHNRQTFFEELRSERDIREKNTSGIQTAITDLSSNVAELRHAVASLREDIKENGNHD